VRAALVRAAQTPPGSGRPDNPIRSIGCILVPCDGLALFLFEGPSSAAVHNQSTRAGVPFDRIVEAVQIEPAENSGW
jgi:hypothetical protein